MKLGVNEGVGARAYQHLPLYLTHLLTYLYKQASSVSSIRVSVQVRVVLPVLVHVVTHSYLAHLPYL